MKKRFLALLLVCVMIIPFAGCGAPAAQTPGGSSGGSADYADMKVVALLSGVITDNGWNQICYEPVKNLETKYGVPCEYIESIAVSDMPEYIRMYGEDGYDMVIVHGSQFEAAVTELADTYPDTMFCLSYGFRVSAETSTQANTATTKTFCNPGVAACDRGSGIATLSRES